MRDWRSASSSAASLLKVMRSGGQNLHIVPGPDSLFLFLGFHAANVGDFPLDGLNGLELIHRLNVQGHSQLGIQLQDFSQQTIRQLGGHDLQVGRRPVVAAHPECAAIPEVKAVWGDIVLCPHPGLRDVLPCKAERLPAAGMELAMQQGQPLPPVKGLGLYPQPFEVAHHIGLHPAQPGAGLGSAGGGQPKGDVFGALNAVVALGDLAFEHFHIFLPDAVVVILLRGDVHLVAAGAAGTAVDKGELERQGAVKVVKARTPAGEDGRLILGGRHGIVDVLIFHGLGVDAAGELAQPVRVHGDIGDRLLGRQRRPAFTCPCGLFGIAFLQ